MIKGLGVFVLFFFLVKAACAQELWGGGVDDEALHFGFILQNVNTDLIVLRQAGQAPADAAWTHGDLLSVSSVYRSGFGLGGLANLKMTNNTDLRFTPTLAFANRLTFFEYENKVFTKRLDATTLELPLSVKLKSNRRKNFRAYLLAGPKYSINFIGAKKLNDELLDEESKLLKLTKGFLSYETAIGLDLYFENFKLSPEVKFSQSVNDVLRPDANRFRNAVDKMFLRSIQLSLYLE